MRLGLSWKAIGPYSSLPVTPAIAPPPSGALLDNTVLLFLLLLEDA
jgi:hypothetical protein